MSSSSRRHEITASRTAPQSRYGSGARAAPALYRVDRVGENRRPRGYLRAVRTQTASMLCKWECLRSRHWAMQALRMLPLGSAACSWWLSLNQRVLLNDERRWHFIANCFVDRWCDVAVDALRDACHDLGGLSTGGMRCHGAMPFLAFCSYSGSVGHSLSGYGHVRTAISAIHTERSVMSWSVHWS